MTSPGRMRAMLRAELPAVHGANLITRYRPVHLLGPCVDAAREVINLLEGLRQEVLRGRTAAHPMVAVEDDRRAPVERLQVFRSLLVQMPRALDRRDVALALRAD